MKYNNAYMTLYNFVGERTLNCSWYHGNNFLNFMIGNSYGHGYLGGYIFTLSNDGLRLYDGISIGDIISELDLTKDYMLKIDGVDFI